MESPSGRILHGPVAGQGSKPPLDPPLPAPPDAAPPEAAPPDEAPPEAAPPDEAPPVPCPPVPPLPPDDVPPLATPPLPVPPEPVVPPVVGPTPPEATPPLPGAGPGVVPHPGCPNTASRPRSTGKFQPSERTSVRRGDFMAKVRNRSALSSAGRSSFRRSFTEFRDPTDRIVNPKRSVHA